MKDNIPGIPNHYVSKTGEVYRKDRYYNTISGTYFSKRGGKWKKLNIQIFKARKGSYEYSRVHICTQTNTGIINRLIKVSRLVALAYIPNPENKPIVCHKDNNPLNNNVNNLYWGTQSENIRQCVKEGRFNKTGKTGLIGELNGNSKYSNRLKLRIFRYKNRHPECTLIYLSNKFGIGMTTIHNIVTNKGNITSKLTHDSH
jgi:hypothetical protein